MNINSDKKIYYMGQSNKAAAYACPGDVVKFETLDCYDGMVNIKSPEESNIDQRRINPATGPLYIQGAQPFDTVVVEILDISIKDKGIMRISPEFGALPERVNKSMFKIMNIKDGKIYFKNDYAVNIKPMIGVIGTSPSNVEIENETPGDHGGNMDTNNITIGSKVYLPVFVEGGLLAIGDIHASMGDGEVSGTGVEVSGEITVKIDIIKNTYQKRPYVETKDAYYFVCSAETLEKASKLAVQDSVEFIMKKLDFSFEDAYMLASLGCNLRISQIVDPLMTVRMEVPKELLFS